MEYVSFGFSIVATILSIISICIDLGLFQYKLRDVFISVKIDNINRLFVSEDNSSENDLSVHISNYANRDILFHVRGGYVATSDTQNIRILEQYHTLKANSENIISLKTESGCNYKDDITCEKYPKLHLEYGRKKSYDYYDIEDKKM